MLKRDLQALAQREPSSYFSKEGAQEEGNWKTKNPASFYACAHHLWFGALKLQWSANGGESVGGRTGKINTPENVTQRKYSLSLEGLRSHRSILVLDVMCLKGRYEEKQTFRFKTKKLFLQYKNSTDALGKEGMGVRFLWKGREPPALERNSLLQREDKWQRCRQMGCELGAFPKSLSALFSMICL